MKHILKFIRPYLILLGINLFCGNIITWAEEASPEFKIIDVVVADWNQDQRPEAAVLLQTNDEQINLYVYLTDAQGKLNLIVSKSNLVWTGTMAGTQPYLETRGNKASLLVASENDSIGRNRWHQLLTIAYRKQQFMVLGYTYESYDTLDPEAEFSCDINLATGRGFKNNESVQLLIQNIPLKLWSDKYIPTACKTTQ